MDVLILYERKQRELENSILFQIEIEKRGFTCEVVQFYEASKFNVCNINPPRIILVPHLYNTQSVYRNLGRFGRARHIINMQYEQVLSEKWELLGAHTPKGEAKNSTHICWGPAVVNRLIEGGVPKNNIRVVGPLHLDLLRKEFRENNSIKRELANAYNLDEKKRWMLFISSFTYADIEKSRLKLNENAAGVSLSDFPAVHTQSRNELLRWFGGILKKDKETIFIYRPHPDEISLESVYFLEKKFNNFVVIKSRAVKDWISASSILYTWYSTSIVEAHFLGKTYSILRPFELPSSFDSVLLKHGKFIKNYDDFEIDFFQDDENRIKSIEEVHIKQFYLIDEFMPSFELMGDLVEEKFRDQSDLSTRPKDSLKYWTAKIKSLCIYPVYAFFRLSIHVPNFLKFKNKGIFSIIKTEMINQIATAAEKDNIKMRLKKIITK